MSLLEVQNLKVHFPVQPGVFRRAKARGKAVDDVSFAIAPGETLGLAGESGSSPFRSHRLTAAPGCA